MIKEGENIFDVKLKIEQGIFCHLNLGIAIFCLKL